jgi:hypothetical protein
MVIRLARLAASLVVLANVGCDVGAAADCTRGTSRCNGDVLESCEDSSSGSYFGKTPCTPGVCIESVGGGPFCALSTTADARCAGSRSRVCDAGTLISCHFEFATGVHDCTRGESPFGDLVLAAGTSGVCVDAAAGAQCAAEAEPAAECPSNRDYFIGCSGNDQIRCRFGYVVERIPCGAAFCRGRREAVCSLAEEPDPACAPDQRASSFCAGETLVHCLWGYRVSEQPCAAGEVCGPFSVGLAACSSAP